MDQTAGSQIELIVRYRNQAEHLRFRARFSMPYWGIILRRLAEVLDAMAMTVSERA